MVVTRVFTSKVFKKENNFSATAEHQNMTRLDTHKLIAKTPPPVPPKSRCPQPQMHLNIEEKTDVPLLGESEQMQNQEAECTPIKTMPRTRNIVQKRIKQYEDITNELSIPNMPGKSEHNKASTSNDNQFVQTLGQDTDEGIVEDIYTNDMPLSDENQPKKGKVGLNALLIGKTGTGKSAIGNSILGGNFFQTSCNMTSETKEVTSGSVENDECVFTVVDVPGMADTDSDKVTDMKAAVQNMSKALTICNGGVDAFLLAVKFGDRFTAEDRSSLDALKNIFGDTFMNHAIVVMTYGDLFSISTKSDYKNTSNLKEWWKQQKGPFRQLCEDCNGRVVMFNNTEMNDEAQVLTLIELVNDLHTCHDRYTSQSFQNADCFRKRMMSALNAPVLGGEFQEEISLLTADIEALPIEPSKSDKKKNIDRIQNLKRKIKAHDMGSEDMQDLMTELEKMEANPDDTIELKRRTKKLERIRAAIEKWSVFDAIILDVLSSLPIRYTLHGGIASGVFIGVSCVIKLVLHGLEKYQDYKINKIQTNMIR